MMNFTTTFVRDNKIFLGCLLSVTDVSNGIVRFNLEDEISNPQMIPAFVFVSMSNDSRVMVLENKAYDMTSVCHDKDCIEFSAKIVESNSNWKQETDKIMNTILS